MSHAPRHQRWRSLSTAFMAWLAAQSPELRSEIVATKRQDRVRLVFPRSPALMGYVRHHCLAVFAEERPGRGRSWLFDVDCLPIQVGGGGFICGFCEGEQRPFPRREDVWTNHLFEPFAIWVVEHLKDAEGVQYREVGRTSIAKLIASPVASDVHREHDHSPGEHGSVAHLRFYRSAPPPKRGTF